MEEPLKQDRLFKLKTSFPSKGTSLRLLLLDLLFPFFNATFGFLSGGLYLLIAWIFAGTVPMTDITPSHADSRGAFCAAEICNGLLGVSRVPRIH